ncbi:MAG: HDOD domain-containing protein [Leptothrix sp. (in: b-proteobacteria)]
MPAHPTRPLPTDLSGWTERVRYIPIPVLAQTISDLAALAQIEDERGDVDAARISAAIGDDPLMTLHVLVLASQHRHSRQVTDVETVTGAVMMLGIGRFFRACRDLVPVETLLASQPEAWAGLQRVIERAHRAARFALGFAVHRMDSDSAVLHEAALIHDLAEMLLWCHEPTTALAIRRQLDHDHTLRSATVQQQVLGVTLFELEQRLMQVWHLPELLIKLTNDRAEGRALVQPQAQLVKLAVQIARHTTRGWDDAALPDDVNELASLLNLSTAATLRLIQDINLSETAPVAPADRGGDGD